MEPTDDFLVVLDCDENGVTRIAVEAEPNNVCPVCGGLGEVREFQSGIPGYKWVRCEECDGWGYVEKEPNCEECRNSQKCFEKRDAVDCPDFDWA